MYRTANLFDQFQVFSGISLLYSIHVNTLFPTTGQHSIATIEISSTFQARDMAFLMSITAVEFGYTQYIILVKWT